MPIRLLFVCLGNICRSPSAENIMNHLLQQRQLEGKVVCESAGTSSYHLGSPPDRRMNVAAQKRGLTLVGSARQFQPEDFAQFDWILAMDRSNYRDILSLDSAGAYRERVRLLCDFCRDRDQQEVPDPYYGGEAGFDNVIELLLDACNGLLDFLESQQLAGGKSEISDI